jgi:catechol 2,3-dioxygenase-like lactoylglutathione lyase family enzyme
MLSAAKLIAFAPTVNSDRARAFFQGKLGLRLVEEDQYALVFDSSGTMVRVAKVDVVTPAHYTILGWQVSDIVATISELRQNGVEFMRLEGVGQDELGICRSPSGTGVAWFKDPDDNILSLSQFPVS